MDEGRPVGPAMGRRSAPPVLVEELHGGRHRGVAASRDPGRRREPLLAVPGMVLLAAGAIFAGYYWLHLIPHGSLRAPGFVVALAVVPVTLGLTGYGVPGRSAVLRALARGAAAVMPVLALVGLTTHGAAWTRALGATSLVLAASLLALAVVSERAHRPRP